MDYVARLSQGAEQDGKTQGGRSNWKAPGESVVAIAADEEDPHAESDSAPRNQGMVYRPLAKSSAMRIRSATGGCV
jgi:hypothetical protein